MDWNALSAIGQLVGAVAVVITLGYLSRQLRDQNRALQTTIRDSAFQQLQAWNFQVMADRELGALFQRGARQGDWSEFSDVDRARLVHVLYSFYKVFENIYLHALDGSMAFDVWERNCQVFFAYARQPGCRYYWQERRATFDPRFQALLDQDQPVTVRPGYDVAKLGG